MSPDQFKNQMNAAMNQQKAQQDYAMSGSEQLKKDGNKLVGEGKYNDAIEKYMRVKNNLQDNASPRLGRAGVSHAQHVPLFQQDQPSQQRHQRVHGGAQDGRQVAQGVLQTRPGARREARPRRLSLTCDAR